MVQVYIYNHIFTLSTLLLSTYKNLCLYLKTSTNTPGRFAFHKYDSTAPATTMSSVALRKVTLNLRTTSLRTWTNLVQQTHSGYFILQSKPYQRLSTPLYPLPVATIATTIFNHEFPPIISVQKFPTQFQWGHPLYHGFYILRTVESAPTNGLNQAGYSRH